MARIKIEVPDQRLAEIHIPVRITDMNYGNHVGNDAVVSIIHEARVQFLKKGGFTELNIGGPGLIMADLAVEYLRELFYGDQLIISMAVAEITRLSFELYYEIKAQREQDIFIAAKAKTTMVCYDYPAGKLTPVPDTFKKFLAQV
jgi:acyl-CoA thioesterase FadM